jgi:hypothetical protein
MISGLGKRVFLLNNVHEKEPALFQTRWAMDYLPGPLTRVQIPALNELVGAKLQPVSEPAKVVAPASEAKPAPPKAAPEKKPVGAVARVAQVGSTTRPAVPTGVDEFFLPNNLSFTEAFQAAGREYPPEAHSLGLIYRPVLLGRASVRFLNRKYNLDTEQFHTVLVPEPDRRGAVRWQDFLGTPVEPKSLANRPDPQARFASLEAPLSELKLVTAMQKDFLDWAFRSSQVTLQANEALNIYGGPEVSSAEFRQQCAAAARKQRDAEAKKVEDAYEKKIEAIQTKLEREEGELQQDQAELSGRTIEEVGNVAETLIGLFGKRRSSRRISSAMTKRRMTSKASADVKESKEVIAGYKKEIEQLEKEKVQALEEIDQRWGEVASQVSEISVVPLKKDVLLDLFGVAWFPYYLVQMGEETVELPGYGVSG